MAKNPLKQTEINDLLFNFRAEFEKFYDAALEVVDQVDADNAPYVIAKLALEMAAEQFAPPKGSAAAYFQKNIRGLMR